MEEKRNMMRLKDFIFPTLFILFFLILFGITKKSFLHFYFVFYNFFIDNNFLYLYISKIYSKRYDDFKI